MVLPGGTAIGIEAMVARVGGGGIATVTGATIGGATMVMIVAGAITAGATIEMTVANIAGDGANKAKGHHLAP